MKLKSNQNNQNNQAIFKGYLVKFRSHWLQPFFWCVSSTVSMAIVFSDSSIHAAEQLPSLRASKYPSLEPNLLLHSDPSDLSSKNKNYTIANSGKESDGVISDTVHDKSHDTSEDLPAASKEPVHSTQTFQTSKQVASSSTASPIKPAEAASRDRIAQADTPTPELSEPSTAPEFAPESSDTLEELLHNRWRFSVEPYFFVPLGVQADVTIAGRSASFDLGLDDILNLERAFDAGLRVEAQHDRLGFILDVFYISAAQSGTVGLTFPAESLQRFGINTAARIEGDASLSIDELTIDSAVSYRVVDTVLGNSASSTPYPRLIVAPILGLRTRILWQELEVDNVRIGNSSLPIDREFSSSETTIEPLISTQIGLDLSERWAINLRGDVSGFNINADQDFTWNFLIGTQYHLSRNLSLQLAYRFNGFDFEDGEGIRRTRLNLYQNGIWLSGIFRF